MTAGTGRQRKQTRFSRATRLLTAAMVMAVGLAIGGETQRSSGTVARQESGGGFALRFYGHGVGGIDRVLIPLDAPERPVDIGATDFTIEFWIKATADENRGVAGCSSVDGWITGNTVLDRDIFFAGDYGDFGVSLSGGRIAFGLSVGSAGATLCSTTSVADGRWHHVAVTREVAGAMQIFIDGVPAGARA
ncbi:MAG: LamG-like jellyroll fold domain-containing protein, partial [Caldilineaceae bacterium]